MLSTTSNIESIFCLQAIRDNIIPLTRNFQDGGEDCDLNYTPETTEMPVDYALSNAFGFFGHNVSILWERYQP